MAWQIQTLSQNGVVEASEVAPSKRKRKRAEAERNVTFRLLESASQGIDAGLAVIDKNYQVIWANKLLMDLGVKPDKKCYEVFNNLGAVCPNCGVEKVFKQNASLDVHEYKTVNSKGETIWIELRVTPLKDEQGQVIAAVELAVPITQRKQTEETIKKAKVQTELDKKRLETILETSPSAIVIIDASGKFSYVNKRALQIYGFDTIGLSLDENVAKVKAKRIDGTEFPVEEMPVSRSLTLGEEVHNVEMLIERANGSVIPIIANTAPLRDLQGNITAAIAIFEDITKQKQKETEMQNNETKLRFILDATPFPVALVDAKDDKILY